jgi:hypothetical protein
MTQETDPTTAKSVGNGNLKPFKKGYDPRRWLGGRGRKSPEQREGDEILRAVIWEELSREFDMATMKPTETADTVDALRLMVRTWIKKNPAAVAERIAGKVTDRVDVTSGGEAITPQLSDEERLARMKQLAVLIAEETRKHA